MEYFRAPFVCHDMMDEMALQRREGMAAAGEEAAAREWLRAQLVAWRDSVFCLCLGFARNAADAQDLAQETFAKALARPPAPGHENPKAWLLRVARNTCLDRERRARRQRLWFSAREPEPVEWNTPESRAGEAERGFLVKRAIRRLPGRQRDVLVLREYTGLSYEEIARVLGVRVGTVMSRLNRARRAVLKHYQEACHAQPR